MQDDYCGKEQWSTHSQLKIRTLDSRKHNNNIRMQHQVALSVTYHLQMKDEDILSTHGSQMLFFFYHMCAHPYQSCRCNLLERRLMLRCQHCFHGYTEISAFLFAGVKPKHEGSGGGGSGPELPRKKCSNPITEAPIMSLFYPGNFRLPTSQSRGS